MTMVSKLCRMGVVLLFLLPVDGSGAEEFKLEPGLYEASPVLRCKTAVTIVQPRGYVITLEGIEEEKCGEFFDAFMWERPNYFGMIGAKKARLEVLGNRKFLVVDFHNSEGTGPERKTWFVWKSPLPPE